MVPNHTERNLPQSVRVFKLTLSTLKAPIFDNLAILDFNFTPTDETFDLFSLPATFVPTPPSTDHRLILKQVKDFARKLQWRFSLPTSHNPPRFGLHKSERWPPENLVPPHIRRLTHRLIQGTVNLLHKSHQCCTHPNLAQPAVPTLANVGTGGSLITTADKGGRWVVVPAASYDLEAKRHLNNSIFYRQMTSEIPGPINPEHHVKRLLQSLKERNFITRKEFLFLLPPSNPRERRFKLLPKLHKTNWPVPNMPPARPIVSDTNSSTKRIGLLIDHFLQPLCRQLPSYLKDTAHLIAIVRNTTTLSSAATLFTLDVESLYTNVPVNEGIDAVSNAFLRSPDRSRPDLSILTLLRLLLGSNTFTYGSSNWLQTHGVSMGQAFGGSFANVFMGRWENQALQTAPLKPSLWKRFQDDILGIWEHDPSELPTFVEHLNAQHPKIRLALVQGPRVPFLDLMLSVDGTRNTLSYEPYFKDTDSHLILPPSSHHPRSVFKGLLYGETLRFATHSSSKAAFDRTFKIVSSKWLTQGHTRSAIRSAKQAVIRNTGLVGPAWKSGMERCQRPACPVCPHVSVVNTFVVPNSNLALPIFHFLSCDSKNVIYFIQCKKCNKLYVGETSRSLRDRIYEHLLDIRNASSSSTILHKHFAYSCSISDFAFLAFAHHPSQNTRRQREMHWIRTLDSCSPHGLNTISSRQNDKVNLNLPYSACTSRLVAALKQWLPDETWRVSYTRSKNLQQLAAAAAFKTILEAAAAADRGQPDRTPSRHFSPPLASGELR